MFPNLPHPLRPWVFYGLTVALVVAVSLAPGASTALAMLTPLAATLLLLLVVTREGWSRDGWASLGLHRAGLRFWPAAIGVPVAVVGLANAALWLSGAVEVGASEATRGWGLEMLPVLILGNVVGASVTVSLTEEIGWRGYLLPRLTSSGARPALLLSGLLHGLWHLPVILLTDLYLPTGNRWLVIPGFLLMVTSGGVFMGYLRLRSDSLWPATIAHSAHNAAIAWFGAYTLTEPELHEHLAGESGLFTLLGYLGVAAWLLIRVRRTDPAAAPPDVPATASQLVSHGA